MFKYRVEFLREDGRTDVSTGFESSHALYLRKVAGWEKIRLIGRSHWYPIDSAMMDLNGRAFLYDIFYTLLNEFYP